MRLISGHERHNPARRQVIEELGVDGTLAKQLFARALPNLSAAIDPFCEFRWADSKAGETPVVQLLELFHNHCMQTFLVLWGNFGTVEGSLDWHAARNRCVHRLRELQAVPKSNGVRFSERIAYRLVTGA